MEREIPRVPANRPAFSCLWFDAKRDWCEDGQPGRVPKWSKGTDCKSVIRGFESHRDLSPTPCLAAGRLRSAAVGLRLASLAGFKSHRDLSDDAPFCGGVVVQTVMGLPLAEVGSDSGSTASMNDRLKVQRPTLPSEVIMCSCTSANSAEEGRTRGRCWEGWLHWLQRRQRDWVRWLRGCGRACRRGDGRWRI